MRQLVYGATIALGGFMSAAAVAAGEDAPVNALQTPRGFVTIEEDLWDDLADEPGNHLFHAREAFLMVDVRKAAAELRKAATYLRINAGQAAAGAKLQLSRSAHELESLAKRVEAGTVKSVTELDRASARAAHALSHHHCVIAERSWLAQQTQRAGKQLRAATDNLEHAAAWSGHKLQSATREVIKDTRIISGKLIEGTGFVFDEVGKGVGALGKQVEHVGQGIEPHPVQSADQPAPARK